MRNLNSRDSKVLALTSMSSGSIRLGSTSQPEAKWASRMSLCSSTNARFCPRTPTR